MANWRAEYFSALGVRDESEKANISLYDAYTQLADRTGRLESQRHEPGTVAQTTTSSSSAPTTPSETTPRKPSPLVPGKNPNKNEDNQDIQALLSTARQDLSEAQRSRAELVTKLNKTSVELEKLKKQSGLDSRKLADLSAERTQLQTRLKDRDEELRGKAKLLDDVQDELVSLNLQFNMAEDRSKKLEKENKELVDRWMTRMGKEAEAMNEASKFT